MGSLSNNGDGWSADGGSPDDLPDLPEEWGVIVIPDDLSELSDEVAAIRAELRDAEPPSGWQRLIRRPGLRRIRRLGSMALRAPVLIISMAVLVTIASLFASAWPGPPRQPASQRTATATTEDRGDSLPALDLIGPDGQAVALRADMPAVILLTDGCDCAKLVADTVAAVRPEITVVTVTALAVSAAATNGAGAGTPPTGANPPAQGPTATKTLKVLRDPTDSLRRALKVGEPDGTAAALLVNGGGEIIRRELRTASVDAFSRALDLL
jgi:hypothetical protein